MEKIIELENFLEEGVSLIVIKNSEVVFKSGEHGIRALFDLLKNSPGILRGSMVLDKRVGRAAALLLVKGGVEELVTIKLSKSAKEVLDANFIKHKEKDIVENILGKDNKKICRLENMSEGKDPDDFFDALSKNKIFE